MLKQVVHIVYRAGTGVLKRDDGVIGLTGFDLIKNILEFGATAFNELLEMAGGILTCCQMGIRAFWAQKRNPRGVRIGLVKVLLKQRLLG